MEATDQGLQVAAATRESAKRKREQHDAAAAATAAPGAKRARQIPVLKHEVEVPPDFDEASRNLDPALHGEEAFNGDHSLHRIHGVVTTALIDRTKFMPGPSYRPCRRMRRLADVWSVLHHRHAAGAGVARHDGQVVPVHARPLPDHRSRLPGAVAT